MNAEGNHHKRSCDLAEMPKLRKAPVLFGVTSAAGNKASSLQKYGHRQNLCFLHWVPA